jgi:hypothetical protein
MNALVQIRWTIDIPEERLVKLVGRPDDGSDKWFEASGDAAEEWVRDNIIECLEFATGEPDVECVS